MGDEWTQWYIVKGEGDGDESFYGPYRSRARAQKAADKLNAELETGDDYRHVVLRLRAS